MRCTHAPDTWKEPAGRADECLALSLLWSKSVDRVKVAVADARRVELFELDVAGEDALAALYPFAYAADLGFGSAMRESLVPERSAA